MQKSIFLSVVSLLLLATVSETAAAASNITLGSFYAYGTNISGLPVFYADATAYLGLTAPSTATTATNVTFFAITSTTSSGSSLSVTANDTTSIPDTIFYIDNTTDAFNAAGFVSSTNTSSGLTTSGFKIFGTQLMWISSAGALQQHWYAVPTGESGLFTLVWDASGTVSNSGVPVVVKDQAPTLIGG